MENAIPLGTVVAVVAGIISSLVAAYVALFRHGIAQRERENERRISELTAHVSKLDAQVTTVAVMEARFEQMHDEIVGLKSTAVSRELLALSIGPIQETAKSALALVRSVPTSGASYRAASPTRTREEPTTNPPPRRPLGR